ncbi:unnamed protein product [Euphydryas editha]|uniref:Uncharacterized protein n=1 Tax=Euphydryas editha TaxID=104508 RepID=A0AAU9UD50_EUPED|nr:unnamed protein product [Euphydryas editha]
MCVQISLKNITLIVLRMTSYTIRYRKIFTFVLFCMVITVDVKNVTPRSDNRRQLIPDQTPGSYPDGIPIETTPASKGGGAHADKDRFTKPTTTPKRLARTTPFRITFEESCDYLAHYCLKAYNTGKVCGRTLYYTYHTFKNYCLLDYVNCMERYEVWQIVHMGECFNVTELTEYLLYPYDDDYFLDQYYIMEDH